MWRLSWAFVSALQMIPAPPPPTIGQIHRGGIGQKKQQQQYRQSGRFLSVSFNEDNTAVSLCSLIISMHLCCAALSKCRSDRPKTSALNLS